MHTGNVKLKLSPKVFRGSISLTVMASFEASPELADASGGPVASAAAADGTKADESLGKTVENGAWGAAEARRCAVCSIAAAERHIAVECMCLCAKQGFGVV